MKNKQPHSPYSLALVHLGARFPPHLEDTLAQVQLFNQCPLFIVANQSAINNCSLEIRGDVQMVACEELQVSSHHREFNELSSLDREYREGFWHYACERFFYLEALGATLPKGSALYHLENDVLLYRDLRELHPVFSKNTIQIGGTLDNDRRCIPGMVYFQSSESLTHLNEFITDVVRMNLLPEVNDMILLAAYWRTFGDQRFSPLPVTPDEYSRPLVSQLGDSPKDASVFSRLYRSFNSIFDAAAIGQYLGGVDPKNSPRQSTDHFQNESAVYSAEALQVRWVKKDGLATPYATLNDAMIPINNLHIHSKNLTRFRSDRVIEEAPPLR